MAKVILNANFTQVAIMLNAKMRAILLIMIAVACVRRREINIFEVIWAKFATVVYFVYTVQIWLRLSLLFHDLIVICRMQ